jgi:hypothetical protein
MKRVRKLYAITATAASGMTREVVIRGSVAVVL